MFVAQSCLTLCDPMDCSPPGSSVHGILQARVLEWRAISFSTQCLNHTGSAPAHGTCSLPAHTARALDCSTGTIRGWPWATCTSQVQATQVQALG